MIQEIKELLKDKEYEEIENEDLERATLDAVEFCKIYIKYYKILEYLLIKNNEEKIITYIEKNKEHYSNLIELIQNSNHEIEYIKNVSKTRIGIYLNENRKDIEELINMFSDETKKEDVFDKLGEMIDGDKK